MSTAKHRRVSAPAASSVASATSGATTGGGRFAALDGLRGIAALAVVLYHVTLVVPAVAAVYVAGARPETGDAVWWLYRTPLRVLLAGHEAVLLFFVLSGFVLTLPILSARRRGTPFSWKAYYPRRLARLYVPVWGALVVALILALAVARDVHTDGAWLASHKPPGAARTIKDAVLLVGTSNLDSPLWSLRWEMWFSLLLPLLFGILVLLRFQRWSVWAGVAGGLLVVAASIVGQVPAFTRHLPMSGLSGGLLKYIPVFVLGMMLALERDRLLALGERINATAGARRVWGVLTVLALLGVWAPSAIGNRGRFGAPEAVGYVLSVLGVCVLLFVALAAPAARRLLERPAVQWAGSRSFSIYLIHEPIIVAAALLVSPHGFFPWLFVAVPAIVVALLASEAFYRAVERPAHLLSRWLGRAVQRDEVATERMHRSMSLR